MPPRQLTSDEIGALREIAVAYLVGGTVLGDPGKPGMKIIKPNVGRTDVDVLGPNGEYIVVGGPAKAKNLSLLIMNLHILRFAAEEAGVSAKAYFDNGTPETVLTAARKVLGEENVVTQRLLP